MKMTYSRPFTEPNPAPHARFVYTSFFKEAREPARWLTISFIRERPQSADACTALSTWYHPSPSSARRFFRVLSGEPLFAPPPPDY